MSEQAPGRWSARGRRALPLLLLLAAVALTALTVSDAWIPPGPFAEEAGYAPGSDWDKRWQKALVGAAAQERGQPPWWDPFSRYGAPLYSEPESFLLHPVYFVASALGGIRAGLQALYGFHLLALFAGLAWLGRKLEVPFPLAMACGLALVVSPEWQQRLASGHLMVLGLTLWPAVFAAALSALDEAATPRTAARWGLAAGALMGLMVLAGSHYPLPYALLAWCLVVWAAAAPAWACGLLVVAFAAPIALQYALPSGFRWLFEAVTVVALVGGIWTGGRFRVQLAAAVGLAVGMLATVGAVLLPSLGRASDSRSFVLLTPPHVGDSLSLAELWQGAPSGLDRWLPGLSVPLLIAAALVLVLAALRWRAFATAAAVLLLAGIATGLPLRPWLLLSAVPGVAAAIFQYRLQWALLVLVPVGAAALIVWLLRRFGDERAAWVGATLLGLALVVRFGGVDPWGIGPERLPDQRLPEQAGAASHVQLADGEYGHTISGVLDGGVRREQYAPHQPPELVWTAGTAIGAVHADGEVLPLPDDVRVEGVLAVWTVEAPPGVRVALPQRDFPRWRCDGGTVDPDPKLFAAPLPDDPSWVRTGGDGRWFVTVRVGDSGRAVCRWRPAGLGLGLLVQLVAAAAALALLRRRRGVGPAAGPDQSA
jgi:hypothetical protein